MADSVVIPTPGGREVESTFARDDHDLLVRRERETRERFGQSVTVTIDGYSVTVPRAVPKTDAQGNPLRDADGELIPRTTTIFDAAVRLVALGVWPETELKARIPTLCHQSHLSPVGVCRMCSVHISSVRRGKLTPGRRLVPACQHRVETDMAVTTRAGVDGYNPDTWKLADLDAVGKFAGVVNDSVRVLAEFLTADHQRPSFTPVKRYEDELAAVARTVGKAAPPPWVSAPPAAEYSRNALHASDPRSRRLALPLVQPGPPPEGVRDGQVDEALHEWNREVAERFPYSSRTVMVDHDRCILCDRCVRACADVKKFNVIGHTGKGYQTRISFDLDAVMGESSCVQCGECMVSCPTGALSLRRRVQPRSWADSPAQIPLNPNTPFAAGSGFLTADEMLDVWLHFLSPTRGPCVVFPFRSVPYSYLKWNEGAVRRWVIPAGESRVLCREGEYGSTAFLLQGTGQFHIHVGGGTRGGQETGLLARLLGGVRSRGGEAGLGRRVATRAGNQLVIGEMACLTHRPRTATVVAEADPAVPALELVADKYGWPAVRVRPDAPPMAVVYEVTRNLLDMMQRTASARQNLEEVYTARAVEDCVERGKFGAGLSADRRHEVSEFLLRSGRLEFRRVAAGEAIVAEGESAHNLYFIRLGTVRLFRTVAGREHVIDRRSQTDYFGAVALLADDLRWRGRAPAGRSAGRIASVAAVDPVEVVRVPGDLFREMCGRFPDLKERLIDDSARRLAEAGSASATGVLGEYVNQGLFQAQRLLALDLTSCTRCDECTRACADSHDGHARLLRDGLRFGDFLVATSCRSCHTPHCMDGCPVDAIHRKKGGLEIVIEGHCIGCGLCEKNCPYGAIQMVARDGPRPDGTPGVVAAPRRAVNCDLCGGDTPYCVQACPHDAAVRLSGEQLLGEVTARMRRRGET